VRGGTYLPKPILGVEIPKGGGKMRRLGVPVVMDRMLQQALGQVLSSRYDMEFEEYSYGFRPNRNAHQAVLRAQGYINSGNQWIVDMDLKNFFDEIDHCVLLQILYRKVKCRKTLRLIRKWLRSPIQIKGKLYKRRKGMPQGSPLSPVLSNILLNELDKELESQGTKYVRYADDFSIYCTEEEQARRIGNRIYLYLRDKLHLPINREKSGIRRPEEFRILGYSFRSWASKGGEEKYHLVVSEKGLKSLKSKLKEITRKTRPGSIATRAAKLMEVQRGWIQYFGHAYMYRELDVIDRWVRRRLRYCIWHNWKRPERRRKNLIRLGVNPIKAYQWSRTRKGGWAISNSPIMSTTVTTSRLERRCYKAMLPLYKSIAPHLNEPLYTRPVRTVV
jgi:group II intron reverse transcriptase/maturase